MRPNIPVVFQTVAADLMMRVLPAISPTYHQGTVGMIATLLVIAADEWDRGASRRLEENQAMRDLFRKAAPVVSDKALSDRLKQLASSSDTDYRVSALEDNNCALRAALIELHTQIESQSGNEAREIENAIWKEIAKSTERRRLSTAAF
ncbi:MAG TPA: hypothetical protein VMA09_12035 [Candidatus Binataceae bacterium]|nr:hypothetical protein [Candidatus Binataceae bacterium]